jgi:MFS family permease
VRFGIQSVLLIDAVSFVVSFIAVYCVRVSRAVRGNAGRDRHFGHEFREGMRFFRGNRVLMTLLITGIFIMLGVGALNALDVFFVVGNLHADTAMYGVISGAFGVGALAGASFLAAFAERIGLTRLFSFGVLLTGVLLVLYSRLSSWETGMVVLFLIGVFVAGPNVAVQPLILRETPRDMIGRVTSVLNPLMQAASILSVVVAGALVSTVLHDLDTSALGMRFTAVDTIFTVSGLLSVAGAIYAFATLRRITTTGVDDQSGVEEERAAS